MKEDKGNYIFGDTFGNVMRKTSVKFQLEAAMMSLVMLIIGITATAAYIIGWTDFSLFFKIMTGTNAFFGMLLLYSQLAGLFQSYQSVIEMSKVKDIIAEFSMKGGSTQNG